MICSKMPTNRQDYEVLKDHAQAMGFKRLHELADLPWEKIRMTLKAMKTKYDKEQDHHEFVEFLGLARTMWRLDNSDN